MKGEALILVTGGAGYVGSHCTKELLRQGYEVVVLDNLSGGQREAVLTENFVQVDLLDREALNQVFKEYSIDAVMHFAGLSFIRAEESVRDPWDYYQNNVLGTLNLLQIMREYGVDRMIFSSSAAVYGDPDTVPISEDHPKRPKNSYGKTKWMVEQILEDYAYAYGLRSISLRYFNAAGCDPEGELGENHHPETHLIPSVLDVVLGRRDCVTIFGSDYDTSDGTCIRDYIHVTDLAEAHIQAIETLKGRCTNRAYNLGSGKGYSVREVINACRKVTGIDTPVVEGERRPGDPPQLVADRSLAQKNLGWRPKTTALDEIVRTAWEWRKKTRQISITKNLA